MGRVVRLNGVIGPGPPAGVNEIVSDLLKVYREVRGVETVTDDNPDVLFVTQNASQPFVEEPQFDGPAAIRITALERPDLWQVRIDRHGRVGSAVHLSRGQVQVSVFQAIDEVLSEMNVHPATEFLKRGEALYLAVEKLLRREHELTRELARLLGDLEIAEARVEQLTWVNDSLLAELWRTKDQQSKRVAGNLASSIRSIGAVVLSLISGAAGGVAQEATADWLRDETEAVVQEANEMIQVCDINFQQTIIAADAALNEPNDD